MVELAMQQNAYVVGKRIFGHAIHPSTALYDRDALQRFGLSFVQRPRMHIKHLAFIPRWCYGKWLERCFDTGEYIDWFYRYHEYPIVEINDIDQYAFHFWVGSPRADGLHAAGIGMNSVRESRRHEEAMLEFFMQPHIVELLNDDDYGPPVHLPDLSKG